MASRFNTLLHGDPLEAANTLDSRSADPDELRVALINALRRIDTLERRVADAQRTANRAANDASCLANGIQPD